MLIFERKFPGNQAAPLAADIILESIDWVIDLPGNLELQFKGEVHQIEVEKQMPYITSIERIAKQQGKLEGKLEGELKGKIRMLQELLGLEIVSDEGWAALSEEDRNNLLAGLRQKFANR